MKYYVESICQELDGGPNSDYIINEIWGRKVYEQDYQLQPNDVVIDIGANQGFFSVSCAHKGCRVYSVEPEPQNFGYLTLNTSRYETVTTFPFAISNQNSMIKMMLPSIENACDHGMVTTNEAYFNFIESNLNGTCSTLEVEGKTLNWLLDQIQDRWIDLLKIDCEGAELDVLMGLSIENASRIKRIVMETHPGYPRKDLFRRLEELGFVVERFAIVNEIYGIGELFASRMNIATRVGFADFSAERDSGTVVLDPALSFLPQNLNPKYTWKIDGASAYTPNQSGVISILKDDTCELDVELIIEDNTGFKASCRRYIPGVQNILSRVRQSCKSLSNGDVVTIDKDGVDFVIAAEKLPKDSRFRRMVIGIAQQERKDMKGRLFAKNKEYALAGRYCEIEIANVDVLNDLRIRVADECVESVKLAFWPKG